MRGFRGAFARVRLIEMTRFLGDIDTGSASPQKLGGLAAVVGAQRSQELLRCRGGEGVATRVSDVFLLSISVGEPSQQQQKRNGKSWHLAGGPRKWLMTYFIHGFVSETSPQF